MEARASYTWTGVSPMPAIIHSKQRQEESGADFGDGHETVLSILSSHDTIMFHVEPNTVALNSIIAQTLIPIPCFRQ